MWCINVIPVFASVIIYACGADLPTLHGRYTRDVENYELLVPRKLTDEGKFLTFSIPHYFRHETGSARLKRENDQGDGAPVHYGISLGGREHHIELYPNHDMIAPDAVVERRNRNTRVQDVKMEKLSGKKLCHFRGNVRGQDDSKVALSTCDGLAGYVKLKDRQYLIEPLLEHVPNKRGQHLHVAYESSQKPDSHEDGPRCGTSEDWRDAWKSRFRESLLEDEPRNENKRGLESVHRYIELLVVADKKFLDYHKNTDHELYILTIMNMISDFFHDASSGNQMDVVVVRVMMLEKEEEEIDLAVTGDGQKTLESFCKWQESVNPKDIKNPNHHDIAVLLTRWDLCADNMTTCGLLGLAYVATACSPNRSCAINEDSGLELGITATHELGHVMGCSHDIEEQTGCKSKAEDESNYVMAPSVSMFTNTWSPCSKGFLTALFDADLGECLNDEPETSLYQDNNMLPGSVYDALYQCQLFRPGSTVCEVDDEKFCDRMTCKISPTLCQSNGKPWADGTKCGEKQWCYDKKCVEIGSRPDAINGGWGEWGPYSQCSRTCGAGASVSERDCTNPKPQHKGRYCIGERKRYKICNTQPCPEGTPSFREVQCTEYDSKPFQEKLYKWKPYMKEASLCSLYCINDDNFYVRLAPRAKDGTKCKRGTRNMCLAGICRVVGCDNQIDSDAIDDICGVCKGDGTSCKLVDKTYTSSPSHGYVKVAVIFRGCRNIEIEELKPSDNTIAISGPDESKYYLNADYTERQDDVYDFGGVEGVYSHPEPNREMLIIHGPLKENIVLFVVYYKDENVGYRYKYAEPTPKSSRNQPSYHWEFVDWDTCSARCDGGVQTSQPKCIEEKSGEVTSSFCQAPDKPAVKTRKCNEEPCRTKWRVGKWGKCMSCKNISGLKMREVECVKEAPRAGAEDILVEDELCTEKKPGTKELCSSQVKCTPKKRGSFQLPTEMMERVWLQTVANEPDANPQLLKEVAETKNRHKMIRELKALTKKREVTCQPADGKGDGKGKATEKLKVTVGALIQDRINGDDISMVDIPLKQSHNALNLTDEAFQTMGDKIPDTLDVANEKCHKGEEALKMLKESAHANGTIVESN